MNGFWDLCFTIAGVMAFIQDVTCTGNEDFGLHEYCIETVNYQTDASPIKIIPEYMNKSYSVPSNGSSTHLELSLCPNKTFLKVHLMNHKLEGTPVILCYRKQKSEESVTIVTKCFYIHLSEKRLPSILDCWFPVTIQLNEPVIHVWTERETGDQLDVQYGKLDPKQYDSNNTCADACELAAVSIMSSVTCFEQAFMFFDTRISVHHVTFDATDHEQCSHVPLTIVNQTDNGLRYYINCDFNGMGHLKMFYSVDTNYCLKYQPLRMSCQINSKDEEYTTRLEEAHSFGIFVLFGLGCMTLISIIIAASIFTFQKLQPLWKRFHRQSKDKCFELEERDTVDRLLPSRADTDGNKAQEVNKVHTPVAEVIKKAYIKRMDSFTSEGQSPTKQAKPVKIAKTRDVGKLHRCVTLALLENTDELYRKRVLILPRPYDSFSRDATNLLKTVFTMEGGIPSHCCFDRDIYQQYITSDKYEWIEQTLADRNRILVFLCFTSISIDIKCNSMVVDILDHLRLTRIKPHQFCKVVFLHITDNSDNLANHYHGDSFYMKNAHSYGEFIEDILSYCGKNPDTESAFILQLIRCDASKHFMKFVGVKPLKNT